MPALKLLFRRTLVTPAVNPPPSRSHCHHPLTPSTMVVQLGGVRTLAKGLGAGLKSIPCAHVSIYNKKNIPISNKTNNFSFTNIPQTKKDLYILSPKYHSSSSFFEGERETSERKSIRVSSHFLGKEMGFDENRKQNGIVHRVRQNGVVSYSSDKDDKDHQLEDQCTKLLTLPTVLTLARVAAIPLFIATFYVNSWWGTTATTSIFVAAAITDWLDGYLARKMRLGTAFGAFLDPVADKLMVAATLVLLCSRPPETALLGDIPWLFPVPAIAIIGREITMSAVREWAASQNTKLLQAVAVNNLGKWKTATQMTALTILVASRDSSLASSGSLSTSGVALLYISAGLAIWSLFVYMRKIGKVLLR